MRPMTIAASSSLPASSAPHAGTAESAALSVSERISKRCPAPWILIVIVMSLFGLLLAVSRPAVDGMKGGSGDQPHSQQNMDEHHPDKNFDDMSHMGKDSRMDMGGDHNKVSKDGADSSMRDVKGSAIKSEVDLLSYYNGNDLSGAFEIGDDRGVRSLAEKMYKKKMTKEPFVLGAIGSGTIVGAFGNCQRDGYLSLIETNVREAFMSQGLKFEVRTAVFGSFCGASPKSVTSCVPSLLGNAIDLLHYSFPHSDDDAETRFRLARVSGGSVHVIEPSCGASGVEQKGKGKNARLLNGFSQKGSDVLCLEEALQTVFGDKYKGQSWGLVGDGMHKTTRGSENGVVWRNWAPGPLGHQFIADATSMLLFKALRLMASLSGAPKDMAVDGLAPVPLSPACFIAHDPHHGTDDIAVSNANKWRRLPGESAGDDEIPLEDRENPNCEHPDACGFYEARGSSAGALVFKIPSSESLPGRKVFVCCCCNAELCVEEQFRDYVEFTWSQAVTVVSRAEATNQNSSIVGKECLLIAKDMPFANELTISIKTGSTNVPVRISSVIAG